MVFDPLDGLRQSEHDGRGNDEEQNCRGNKKPIIPHRDSLKSKDKSNLHED